MSVEEKYLPRHGAGREELKIYYSWSIEDALSAQSEWDLAEHQPGERGPVFRWDAAHKLIALAEHFEQTGDKNIILFAISICCQNYFSIPQWCAVSYIRSFYKGWNYEEKSWDNCFERPLPKGAQLGARQQKRNKMWGVYVKIHELKSEDPQTPIDRELFDKVGKKFGICGSLADEYYYSAKELSEKSASRPIVKRLLDADKVNKE